MVTVLDLLLFASSLVQVCLFFLAFSINCWIPLVKLIFTPLFPTYKPFPVAELQKKIAPAGRSRKQVLWGW